MAMRLGCLGAGAGQACRRQICRAAHREHALNAVTNHYQCKDGRWIILSLLNEERQWPALARCLGREDFITMSGSHQARPPCAIAGTHQDLRRDLRDQDLAEWRRILDGNGLVFGVVGILVTSPPTSR